MKEEEVESYSARQCLSQITSHVYRVECVGSGALSGPVFN